MDDLQIHIIKIADHNEVLHFLRQHYYQEEPLVNGREPNVQDPEDEKFNMSQIVHGTSLMAVQKCKGNDTDKRIVGVLLSGPKSIGESEHLFEEADRFGPTTWGTALRILAQAERDSNVFQRYNVTKALHIHVLAVHAEVRGRSLGLRLIKELKHIGRELEYPLLTLDCSSHYSAKLCERLEMDCINVIEYKKYLDRNGKPVFTPPPPHECIKTFATRLYPASIF